MVSRDDPPDTMVSLGLQRTPAPLGPQARIAAFTGPQSVLIKQCNRAPHSPTSRLGARSESGVDLI